MQKIDIDSSSNHKEVIICFLGIEQFCPAEWIPHIAERSCSMLISWMLTPLSEFRASLHLSATEQLRIITTGHSANLSFHANTHS